METNKKRIPFGILFEEEAPSPKDIIIPEYDKDMEISFIKDSEGNRIPYVESYNSLGTQTSTRITNEITDDDPEVHNSVFNIYGTGTVTEVKTETIDVDNIIDHKRLMRERSLLGTETVTKVSNEHTDPD